ncbi:hypothetical protein BTH41_03726 [Bacillus mycoides]|nr:hypothetical protein BTH41_03726 [Bacillus mycoides]
MKSLQDCAMMCEQMCATLLKKKELAYHQLFFALYVFYYQ